MSDTFQDRRLKREVERLKRYREIGSKFNNLFLQFKSFHYDGVSYGCSLLITPSVADVYARFLISPHVYTLDQITIRYRRRTILKALKRLEWFGVIIYDEETKTWSLTIENGEDHR